MDPRKVMAMKLHPAKDRTDPTRSSVLKVVNCAAVISSAFMVVVLLKANFWERSRFNDIKSRCTMWKSTREVV